MVVTTKQGMYPITTPWGKLRQTVYESRKYC